MMVLENVSKNYQTRSGSRTVLEGINLIVHPGQKLGILGGNGAGKSTLIRIISGAELPSSGTVRRNMRVSWPLAFAGGFQGSLTGTDNLRFICRIYGANFNDALPFVKDFTELGKYLYEPVKSYSSGMRARLAFAISMAVDFDCFLIDEVIAVGDSRFHEKCYVELFEKRKDRALILVSHESHYIRTYCHNAAVLSHGKLFYFAAKDEAFAFYQYLRTQSPDFQKTSGDSI
jgi:capsular polysaccharide transport system ATP-binding protein